MAAQNEYYQQYLHTILWNLSRHLLTFFWLIQLSPYWTVVLLWSVVCGEETRSREARLCRIFDAAEQITESPDVLGRTINSLIQGVWRSIEVKESEAFTAVVMKNKPSKKPAWKQVISKSCPWLIHRLSRWRGLVPPNHWLTFSDYTALCPAR
jgi:hypothetical protein